MVGLRGRMMGGWVAIWLAASSACSSTHTTVTADAGSAGGASGSSGGAGRGGSMGSGSGASGGTGARGGASGAGGTGASGGSDGASGSAGTGGTAGAASGGSAGAAGNDAGDAASDSGSAAVSIQLIQDGTVAPGQSAKVERVFVTAFRQTVGGEMSFVVQEPQGYSPSRYIYPQYAGVSVFIRTGGMVTSPPSIGDCVEVSGIVEEFQGRTQLTEATVAPATSCGSFPLPFEIPGIGVTFADVATDSNPSVAGNQPGMKAEAFESVLIRVKNLRVSSVLDATRFEVVEQQTPAGAKLLIQGVYYMFPASVDQRFVSLAGIMSEGFGEYRLLPRSGADIFQ
jgi:predicted extracellular nuclease